MTSFDFFWCFLVVQDVDPWPSPDSNKSQIFLLSWVIVLDLHRMQGCREEHHSCSRSNVVVKKNVWSGWRISRHTIQLFFLSSQLTEVPKNRSHSRLIQEYLFSQHRILFRWHAIPIEVDSSFKIASSLRGDRKWRSENFFLRCLENSFKLRTVFYLQS